MDSARTIRQEHATCTDIKADWTTSIHFQATVASLGVKQGSSSQLDLGPWDNEAHISTQLKTVNSLIPTTARQGSIEPLAWR